jgi:hypothetical protein
MKIEITEEQAGTIRFYLRNLQCRIERQMREHRGDREGAQMHREVEAPIGLLQPPEPRPTKPQFHPMEAE